MIGCTQFLLSPYFGLGFIWALYWSYLFVIRAFDIRNIFEAKVPITVAGQNVDIRVGDAMQTMQQQHMQEQQNLQ